MESISVAAVTNNLPRQTITLRTTGEDLFDLEPGQVLSIAGETIPVIHSPDEVSEQNIRTFRVSGFPQEFAFAVIAGQGLVSALGLTPQDFFPDDPHRIHVTVPELSAGQTISASFMIDELADGTRVTWVLGELDEA